MGPKIKVHAILFLSTSREDEIPDLGRLKGNLWVPSRRSKKRSCGVAWWIHIYKKLPVPGSMYKYVHKEKSTG